MDVIVCTDGEDGRRGASAFWWAMNFPFRQ
jgi:hypothetical protein